MGMFDSLYVKCPKCGESVEFQSKAGECMLATYHVDDVPPVVLADLDGQSEFCPQRHVVHVRASCRPVALVEAK